AAVVRVEHKDVDRLRELLDHDDVVEPRRPRRAAEVLEAQRSLQILGHDDASDLVERPVSGALDGIGREPLTDAAGTEVDLQSQAGVAAADTLRLDPGAEVVDRKSTRLNSSHGSISYAVCCLKKKKRS